MAETDELAEEETNSNRSRRLKIKSVFVSVCILKTRHVTKFVLEICDAR